MKLTRQNLIRVGVGLLVAAGIATPFLLNQPEYNPSVSTYVSMTGNDNNACTQSQPCRSYSRAQSRAGDGWNVVFTEGTYPAFIVSKSNLTIGAIGEVVIDANNANRGIDIPSNVSDITIEGLKVINSGSHSIHVRGTRITIRNNHVYNGIWENANVSNRQITSCRNSGWGSGIKGAAGARDMVVVGNRVYNNCGEGIALTRVIGTSLVEYNVVYDNFSVGIYVDNSNGVTVRNNHSYCTGDTRFYRSGDPMRGITLGNEQYTGWGNQLGNVLIASNFVDGCRGMRLYNYFSGNPPNLVIRDNWFRNVPDALIIVPGAILSNNVTGTPPQSWFDAFGTQPTPIPVTPSMTFTRTPTATRTPTSIPPSVTPSVTLPPSITPSVTPIITSTPGICAAPELIYDGEFQLWLCK